MFSLPQTSSLNSLITAIPPTVHHHQLIGGSYNIAGCIDQLLFQRKACCVNKRIRTLSTLRRGTSKAKLPQPTKTGQQQLKYYKFPHIFSHNNSSQRLWRSQATKAAAAAAAAWMRSCEQDFDWICSIHQKMKARNDDDNHPSMKIAELWSWMAWCCCCCVLLHYLVLTASKWSI